jgi:TP901 family phage tail tape measure protein
MGAAAFTIPSIFTAIDKVSSVVKTMGANVQNFANKAEVGIARSERMFRKLTPSISGAAKEFLSFASTAAIVAAIVGGITFSFNALKDYETSLASLRTITGLTTEEFVPFKAQIESVAKDTKSSAIDVAKSFELIASANADLLKSPKDLAAVSKAAITLSQASGMSIADAAGSLTNSMNQFGVGADKANDFINILVQSQAAGTATVQQLSDSLVKAGGTAKAFGMDFDQTNAFLQAFAKGGVVGSEAGTQLAGVLAKLSKVKQKEFNPAMVGGEKALLNLMNANLSYTQLLKLTDAEGAKWLTTLVNQKDVAKQLSGNLNVTNAALDASAKQNDTLAIAGEQAKNAFVNLLVSSNKLSSGLNVVKRILQFVGNNMETIVTIGVGIIGFFVVWKALLIASRIALIGYNLALGISAVLSGSSAMAIRSNVIAMGAYKTITAIVTAAQWAWNAAMMANPIGLIILAILAMIAVIVIVVKKYNEWGAAITFLLGPIGFMINLIQSFRRNWDMITESFKTGGVLKGFLAIGKAILDAVLMPLQQVLKIISNLTGFDWAKDAMKGIESLRADMGVNVETDESGNPIAEKKLINPKESVTTQNQNVAIDINDRTGRASVDPGNNMIPIKLSSTLGFGK